MTSNPERIGFWPVVALPVAGLLALAISTSGLAQDEPTVKADEPPRLEAAAAPISAVGPRMEEPQISYEVRLLGGDGDLIGLDFDFEVGGNDQQVSIGFLSDLERYLLIGSVSQSSSGWMMQAPKVTSFEGSKASIIFPSGPGLDLDGVSPSIGVEVSATIDASRKYIQLSIQLTEEDPAAGRRNRQARVTIPEGGTVMLSVDDMTDPQGRQRLMLLTPRRILTEEEEALLGLPDPGRNLPLKSPPRG